MRRSLFALCLSLFVMGIMATTALAQITTPTTYDHPERVTVWSNQGQTPPMGTPVYDGNGRQIGWTFSNVQLQPSQPHRPNKPVLRAQPRKAAPAPSTAQLEKAVVANTAAVNSLKDAVGSLAYGLRTGAERYTNALTRWGWLWLIAFIILIWALRGRRVNVTQTNTCHRGGCDFCGGYCPYRPMNVPGGTTKSEPKPEPPKTGAKTIVATVSIPEGMEQKKGLKATATVEFTGGTEEPAPAEPATAPRAE